MIKLAISGDRDWSDRETIKEVLSKYLSSVELLILGDARGTDQIAAEVAEELGFPKKNIVIEKAEWNKYHLAAGPIRNQKMIDHNPDILLAFHNNLMKSKGTKDCVNRAKDVGITVNLYHSKTKET